MRWCKGCKHFNSPGYITTSCLRCKWQYVGQESFDRKADLWKAKDEYAEHPKTILGNLVEYAGCEII